MSQPSQTAKWKRGAAAGAGFALVATLVATTTGPSSLSASSHREAPLIAGDPRADNTDVYAFVSPDDEDSVTIIANWLPFSEPNGGPNFYPWADGDGATTGASYKINIDNDGDAVADIVYEWLFDTVTKDPGQFLVNTGPFDSVTDETLNVYQTYDLLVTEGGVTTTVLDDAISAPSISGAVSTPDYQPLVDEAVESGTAGDLKSFAGQADDPFFLDLRVFDLLYGAGVKPEIGEDTLAGYNVNTIALQVPKTELAINGDAANNPVVGIWSTTDRIVQTEGGSTTEATLLQPDPTDDDEYKRVQVSRLGNPLVNEVVLPLALKDAFNSIPPSADAGAGGGPLGPDSAVAAVRFPILPPLVQAIYGVPVPGDDAGTPGDTSDDAPRSDLVEIFLQGVSKANFGLGLDGEDAETNPKLNADLNGHNLNADAGTIQPSEQLRLNMAVPVSANPSAAGVLGGDFQGFPNGRRLEDDVVDIALAVAEGAVFKGGSDVSGLAPFDSVDRNDLNFKDVFPYVANPHLDSVNAGSIPPQNTPRNPSIISINPTRILDTRTGTKAAAGSTTTVNLGAAAVPSDAQAAFLNITAAQTEAVGFVTAFPCDVDGDGTQDARPLASSLNPDPARINSGLVSVAPDAAGDVCIYTETATQLVVDVQAFIPSTSEYTKIVANRLLDTRNGTKAGAESTQIIDVSDVDGVEGADGSKAVLLNLTSVRTESRGWLTAYPCDAELPNTSNLNTEVGTRRANLASVKVSADDTVCVYSKTSSDVVVDVVGAFPTASGYEPIVPVRLLDTRPGAEQTGYTGAKPIAGQVVEIDVRGPGTDVPDDAGTVVLNVTGVTPEGDPGYLTVFPCGEDRPLASNLNLLDINTAAASVAKVGINDRVCVYTFQPAHVLVDIVGFFPGTVLRS